MGGTPKGGVWTLGLALRYTSQLPKGEGKRGGWGEGCKSGKKLIEVGQRVIDYFGADRRVSEITSPDIDAYVVQAPSDFLDTFP
jgi:hypothetical protein